ncbi:cyclophilin-like fold protein [Variovorax sp. LARHSF232]
MKIQLKLNGQVTSATLANNRTAREFAAMLPLSITMHDLFEREKFGALPAAISGKGTRTQYCEAGDIICWSPGPDVAIFYRSAAQPIRGAHHHLGRLDFGVEAFEAPGPLEVIIDLAPGAMAACRQQIAMPEEPEISAFGRP